MGLGHEVVFSRLVLGLVGGGEPQVGPAIVPGHCGDRQVVDQELTRLLGGGEDAVTGPHRALRVEEVCSSGHLAVEAHRPQHSYEFLQPTAVFLPNQPGDLGVGKSRGGRLLNGDKLA